MKRRGILEFMKNFPNPEFITEKSSHNNIQALIEKVFLDLLLHYEIDDIEKGTNHQLIFQYLYRSNTYLTFEEVARKTITDIDTLKRYIKRYNKTALDLVKVRGKDNNNYIDILELFQCSENS